MHDAYRSRSAKTAKKLLMQLVSWLEANGEDSAAASLREGLDETLTVLRLNLGALQPDRRLLARLPRRELRVAQTQHVLVLGAGILVMSFMLARAFGRFHGGL
jgi:hypothetical protein